MNTPRRRHGFSSVLATFYVTLFSGLAIAYTAMCGINSEVTGNARNEQLALTAAESGLSVLRYHIGAVQAPSQATSDEMFAALGETLQAALGDTLNVAGQPVTVSEQVIVVPTVAIDLEQPGTMFRARIVRGESGFVLSVTGAFKDVSRTIRVTLVERETPPDMTLLHSGIVSRGSIDINGACVLRSNVPGGSSVMSLDATAWAPIHVNGSGRYDGDFYTVKDGVTASDVFNGSAEFLNPATGEYESDAAGHVHDGIDEPAWPEIDTETFRTLITALPHTRITRDTDLHGTDTLHNVYIEANADPRFNGTVTITGIVYVEWPNDIRFNGAVNITGLIVCQKPPFEPDPDDSPTNTLLFNGAITSVGAENLPDTAEYAGLREQTGAFLLAPDYEVTFNGAMGTLNGTVYTSGLRMNGATSGTVRGSIIVDRRSTFRKNGSVDLMFEVDPAGQAPAGLKFPTFKTIAILEGSYQEA